MRCPKCGHQEDKVVDSRPADEGAAIRRRRECLNCHYRYTTYEKIESLPTYVVKKDGSRQVFDRQKLLSGLVKACQKRPVGLEQLDPIVRHVEQRLGSKVGREISSQEIGEIIMEDLRHLDKVAYVRFASVYREFKDVQSFLTEMQELQKQEEALPSAEEKEQD